MLRTRKNLSFVSLASLSLLALGLSAGSALSLTACGGGGSGGSGGGSTSTGCSDPVCFDYSKFDGTTPVTTFQADVLPIFRNSCGLSSTCHGSEQSHPPDQHYLGPKNKDPAPTAAQIQAIFDQNVGKASVLNPDMPIIDPGKPENSFLMYKLDGVECDKLTCAAKGTCDSLMPDGSTCPMEIEKRDVVRRWIAQGAKND
jgi:hypothetical protein